MLCYKHNAAMLCTTVDSLLARAMAQRNDAGGGRSRCRRHHVRMGTFNSQPLLCSLALRRRPFRVGFCKRLVG